MNRTHTRPGPRLSPLSRRQLPQGYKPGGPTGCDLCPSPDFATEIVGIRLCETHMHRVTQIVRDARWAANSGRVPECMPFRFERAS